MSPNFFKSRYVFAALLESAQDLQSMNKRQDVDDHAQTQFNTQLRPQTMSTASSHFASIYINPGWALLRATQGQAQQMAEEYRRTYGDPVENLSSIVTLAPEDLPLLLGDES